MLSFAAWYAASARLIARERKSPSVSDARVSLRGASRAGRGGAADFRSNVPEILGFGLRAMTVLLENEKGRATRGPFGQLSDLDFSGLPGWETVGCAPEAPIASTPAASAPDTCR